MQGLPAWLPAVVGFLLGGLCLWIVDKLLPHLQSHRKGNVDLATLSLMLGFAVMMVLDVALG